MIRRLELHSFATHQDTEIEFGGGKNVIIGATGSGKTNLLQALDFAFTGEVSGTNLSELIADSADAAEVILDYVEPRTGQSYRIHRTLNRDADGKVDHECSLTNLDTNESVRKPIPVQKTLESLGVIPSVFRHVVHVAQGSFSELLEETQERKNTLDRLFRISQLETAYQELGHQGGPINQIEERQHSKLEKKRELEAVASKLNDEKAVLERILKERGQKQTKLEETTKELERLKQMSERNLEILSLLHDVEEKIRRANAAAESSLSQGRTLLLKLTELLPQETCSAIEKRTSKENTTYLETIKSQLSDLQKQLANADNIHRRALEEVASTQSQINLSREEKASTSSQISAIGMYLEGKGEQPSIECDKCGSLLTKEQWTKHIKEKQELLENLEKKIEQLLVTYQADQHLADECKKKLEEANSDITRVTNAIFLLRQYVEWLKELEKASTSVTVLSAEKDKLIEELISLLQAKSTTLDNEIIEQAIIQKKRLEILSEQITELNNDMQRYDENHLKPQEKRVADAEAAADQLKSLEPEVRIDEEKISLLHIIRKALREVQPAVRRSFVSRITQSANDYLTRLYGQAEIQNFELTEDYEFFVTRAGYRRHANRLSGGQQVLASMAFLLALSEVLSQLDFLVLDEPTTHLDTNRRAELVIVLENLRRVPQLIIVDHHQELLGAADTRFQVSLSPEGHSQLEQIS